MQKTLVRGSSSKHQPIVAHMGELQWKTLYVSVIGLLVWQVRRAATRNLKLGDDKDSLEMKVRFTQPEATAERIWRTRMNTLLAKGQRSLGYGDMRCTKSTLLFFLRDMFCNSHSNDCFPFFIFCSRHRNEPDQCDITTWFARVPPKDLQGSQPGALTDQPFCLGFLHVQSWLIIGH